MPILGHLKTSIEKHTRELAHARKLPHPNEIEAALENCRIDIDVSIGSMQTIEQKSTRLRNLADQTSIYSKSIQDKLVEVNKNIEGWQYLKADVVKVKSAFVPYRTVETKMRRQKSILAIERLVGRLKNLEQEAVMLQQKTLVPHQTIKTQHREYKQLIKYWKSIVKDAKGKAKEWGCLRESVGYLEDIANQLQTVVRELKKMHYEEQIQNATQDMNQEIEIGNEVYELLKRDYMTLWDKSILIRRYFSIIDEIDWGANADMVKQRSKHLRRSFAEAQSKATTDQALHQLLTVQRNAEGHIYAVTK